MYVGITQHALNRVEKEKDEKGKENEKREMGEKTGKENKKTGRKVEDGLLLLVPAKIYGKTIKELIDSRETRCFVTPSCVATVGLKPRELNTSRHFPRIRKWGEIPIQGVCLISLWLLQDCQ